MINELKNILFVDVETVSGASAIDAVEERLKGVMMTYLMRRFTSTAPVSMQSLEKL